MYHSIAVAALRPGLEVPGIRSGENMEYGLIGSIFVALVAYRLAAPALDRVASRIWGNRHSAAIVQGKGTSGSASWVCGVCIKSGFRWCIVPSWGSCRQTNSWRSVPNSLRCYSDWRRQQKPRISRPWLHLREPSWTTHFQPTLSPSKRDRKRTRICRDANPRQSTSTQKLTKENHGENPEIRRAAHCAREAG